MWYLFAFSAAFSWATADLFSKFLMNIEKKDEYSTLFARFVFSLPILFTAYILTFPHKVNFKFWLVNAIIIPGDILASTLYMKALRISPISLVVPLMGFTPVFMIITSIVLLSEFPSVTGVVGVVAVTAGAYMLNLRKAKENIFAPFKALLTSKGPLYTLAAAFIYSVDTALGKKAIEYSDVFFFSFIYTVMMTIGYMPIVVWKGNFRFEEWIVNIKGWAVGLFFAVGVVSFLLAIKSANIAYVSAFGKLSMVIAVFYGRIFFDEEGFKERISGAILMIFGIFLIFLR